MGQGQDHVYVVFSLPALSSPTHRSRALPPGPWGTDVQARGLMGLVGHTYVQKGAVLLPVGNDRGMNEDVVVFLSPWEHLAQVETSSCRL